MRRNRSLLFVPGHREAWIRKAVDSGADAVILDLEDSVPAAEKDGARDVAARAIAELAAGGAAVDVWLRPNSWQSRLAGRDLDRVVLAGLAGLLLPKVEDVADVVRFDALVTHFEVLRGLPDGQIRLLISLETAPALAACERLASASPRVVSLVGATARGGDMTRAIGYEFTPEGLETLYLRSRVVLACRAAGLDHPITGLWQDIADLDGLRRFSEGNRRLGYRGQLVIHPSHVPVVNDVFAPTEEELAFYRGMIAAFERGAADGRGAVVYAGEHIDLAHVENARAVLSLADRR